MRFLVDECLHTSLVTLAHLERAYSCGLRAVGPAHYGPGRYAQGTKSAGGLPAAGRELLKEMERLGIILDVTHLTDECFWEALEIYSGPIWASHHNCRALVPDQRQLGDDQIKALAFYHRSSAFDAQEKAVILYAERVTRGASGIRPEALNELKQYFNDDQIVELTLAIGVANLTNRFNDAMLNITDIG